MTRRDPRAPADAETVLSRMWTIRYFEEGLEELFTRGLLHGTMHLSIGQEAVPEGVCGALDDGDFITSTHRGHGHALAHGGDPTRMMAELLMKDTGYCRGRGGSMTMKRNASSAAPGNISWNATGGATSPCCSMPGQARTTCCATRSAMFPAIT